jgi:Putative zinc-finger
VRAMSCDQLVDAAPELALGVLAGEERAAALAHLDGCAPCQHVVSSLTGVTDRLVVALTPSVEPPLGFEDRVLTPLVDDAIPRVTRRRAHRPVALVATAVAACLAVVAVTIGAPRSASSSVVTSAMRASDGQVVGQLYLHEEPSAVLALSLPRWADRVASYGPPGTTYAVRITRTDGPDRILPVTMNDRSSWAAALDFDPRTVATVALVDSTGYVWCQANVGL